MDPSGYQPSYFEMREPFLSKDQFVVKKNGDIQLNVFIYVKFQDVEYPSLLNPKQKQKLSWEENLNSFDGIVTPDARKSRFKNRLKNGIESIFSEHPFLLVAKTTDGIPEEAKNGLRPTVNVTFVNDPKKADFTFIAEAGSSWTVGNTLRENAGTGVARVTEDTSGRTFGHEFGHLLGIHHPAFYSSKFRSQVIDAIKGGSPTGTNIEYHLDRRSLMGAGADMRGHYFKVWKDYLNSTEPWKNGGGWRAYLPSDCRAFSTWNNWYSGCADIHGMRIDDFHYDAPPPGPPVKVDKDLKGPKLFP